MTYERFVEESVEKQAALIRQWASDPDSIDYILNFGHAEIHYNEKIPYTNKLKGEEFDEKMYKRISEDEYDVDTAEVKKDVSCLITEAKNACSSFVDKESALFFTKEIIFLKAREIAHWLCNYTNIHDTCTFTVDFGDMVGKGIDKNLEEKKTSVCTIVLARNIGEEKNMGQFFFYPKTVYPNILSEEADKTGKVYGKEAIDAIKGADEQTQILWIARLSGCKNATMYEDERRGIVVKVPFRHNGLQCALFIDPDSKFHRYPYVRVYESANDFRGQKVEKAGFINEETKVAIEKKAEIVVQALTGPDRFEKLERNMKVMDAHKQQNNQSTTHDL